MRTNEFGVLLDKRASAVVLKKTVELLKLLSIAKSMNTLKLWNYKSFLVSRYERFTTVQKMRGFYLILFAHMKKELLKYSNYTMNFSNSIYIIQ